MLVLIIRVVFALLAAAVLTVLLSLSGTPWYGLLICDALLVTLVLLGGIDDSEAAN